MTLCGISDEWKNTAESALGAGGIPSRNVSSPPWPDNVRDVLASCLLHRSDHVDDAEAMARAQIIHNLPRTEKSIFRHADSPPNDDANDDIPTGHPRKRGGRMGIVQEGRGGGKGV